MSETSSRRSDNCRCDYSYMRQKNKPKFQGQSTAKSHFRAYPIEKKEAFEVPKVTTKHYDPQSLKTSYKMQYQKPMKVDTSANIHPQSTALVDQYYKNKKTNAPFYSDTEYKKSFESKEIKVEKQPAYEYKPNKNKFEGVSAYKEQFISKKNPDLVSAGQQIVNYMDSYKKDRPKFQGASSYKQTFQKPEMKLEKKPEYKYQPKNTRFEGQSSYKTTFVQLPKDSYKSDLEYCPIHPERIAVKK